MRKITWGSTGASHFHILKTGPIMFPAKFPLEEFSKLTRLIKDGKATEDLTETLKLGMWITGCTLELLDNPEMSVEGFTKPRDIKEALEFTKNKLPEGPIRTQAIDPALLLAIMELVKLIISNRQKGAKNE